MSRRPPDKKALRKIVHQYFDDALSDKITVCKYVKLFCKRHLNDLKNGHERGLYFDEDRAARAVNFFFFLKLWKGKEWKGKPFILAPHMIAIVWVLMGWTIGQGGPRRFQTAHIEVGRKNAKSALGGGLGAYFLVADGEQGAEVYTAAVTRAQAKIVWENIYNFLENSPFADKVEFFRHSMAVLGTKSKCIPLSADKKSADGPDTSCGILDELHAHPTREIYDLMVDSAARDGALVITITTAGFNQFGICYENRDYLTKILKGAEDGSFIDDTVFGVIFTLDTKKDWPELKERQPSMDMKDQNPEYEDDWKNEDVWVKSNPGLIGITDSGKRFGIDKKGDPIPGYMIKIEKLRARAANAMEMPSAMNNFLTKRMNVWTNQADRHISIELWDENNIAPVIEDDLIGHKCYAGVDLAAISDFAVFVMSFPRPDRGKGYVDLLARVWCPESRLFDTKNRYRDQYKAWKNDGWMMTTPGDVLDWDFIRAQIVDDFSKFKIKLIGIDRGFGGYEFERKLSIDLGATEKDPVCVLLGMGFRTMGPLMLDFDGRLLARKLNNGGNPILRFAADNLAVKKDPAGNTKPDKAASQGKIDPIIGILLANACEITDFTDKSNGWNNLQSGVEAL